VLIHREVSVLEIDPVELLGDLDGLVELTTGLVQLAEQVVAAAFLVEVLRIVNHVQLNRNHGQFGLELSLLLSLSDHAGATSETHVAKAHLGHIEALCLDTHLRHVLPNCVVLDIAHAVVGLVHVTDSQVEREVHNGLFSTVIDILESKEVLHWPSQNYHV